jgi:hypothetical protein
MILLDTNVMIDILAWVRTCYCMVAKSFGDEIGIPGFVAMDCFKVARILGNRNGSKKLLIFIRCFGLSQNVVIEHSKTLPLTI